MFAIIAIFLKYVFLNKNVYLKILNESGTYEQIKDSIYKKIDDTLSSKNIKIDIKEAIITEDDLKREADSVISGIIEYLKTGQNNVKPIDTKVYKERVSDVLYSIIGNVTERTNNDLSFNNNLQAENIAYAGSEFKLNNMMVIKEQSKVEQVSIEVEKLMAKEEAEAKVRALLKQKGLTEEQAIQKAIEKGITEEQALEILAGYGIIIDEESQGDKFQRENSNNSNSSSVQREDNTNEKYNKGASPNGEIGSTINEIPTDKNIKNPLDNIANKLLDEAGNNIEKEIDKINLNKILESSKMQKLAKTTSITYKLFWLFMILPILFIALLIIQNNKDVNASLKYIRNAFLLVGLIFLGVFFSAYALRVYTKINIDQVYFKETISYMIQHFLLVLSKYGIVSFVIGLSMYIPTIKRGSNAK